MYRHTVYRPVDLVFEPKLVKCPVCKKEMEEHIVCEGARFHVLSWDNHGSWCSEPNCEINHERRHRLEREAKKHV